MLEMKKIYFNKSDQLTVYSDGIHYELEWMSWGHDIREFRKKIEQSDFEAYRNGKHSGADLIFKTQNGVWPPEVTQEEADRIFLRNNIALLQNDADNQRLFTRMELEKILPKGTEILASSDDVGNTHGAH